MTAVEAVLALEDLLLIDLSTDDAAHIVHLVLDKTGAVPADCLIGPGEICKLAGVSRTTLKRWVAADFPKPIRELEIGQVWDRRAVEAWLETRRG